MINIIFLLIAGSALAYISKYNLQPVSVNLGIYNIVSIPLFFVIAGSVLVGLVLSYAMQLLSNIFVYFKLRGKSRQIKTGQAEILELTKTIHQLQLENEKLKQAGLHATDPKAM